MADCDLMPALSNPKPAPVGAARRLSKRGGNGGNRFMSAEALRPLVIWHLAICRSAASASPCRVSTDGTRRPAGPAGRPRVRDRRRPGHPGRPQPVPQLRQVLARDRRERDLLRPGQHPQHHQPGDRRRALGHRRHDPLDHPRRRLLLHQPGRHRVRPRTPASTSRARSTSRPPTSCALPTAPSSAPPIPPPAPSPSPPPKPSASSARAPPRSGSISPCSGPDRQDALDRRRQHRHRRRARGLHSGRGRPDHAGGGRRPRRGAARERGHRRRPEGGHFADRPGSDRHQRQWRRHDPDPRRPIVVERIYPSLPTIRDQPMLRGYRRSGEDGKVSWASMLTADVSGSGDGGATSIAAADVKLADGRISSVVSGSGAGGDVSITAKQIKIDGSSFIGSDSRRFRRWRNDKN